MQPDRIAIEELVYRSCLALDAGDFKGYLDLCDDSFRYTVTAHSPEIRKDMVWLDHDKKEMQLLFSNLPRHNSDHSPLARHAHVYIVEVAADGKSAGVISALQIYKTTLDGGATELFAIGRYLDTVSLGSTLRLAKRIVRLETRQFGFGYHVPF